MILNRYFMYITLRNLISISKIKIIQIYISIKIILRLSILFIFKILHFIYKYFIIS